jgi:hypothetical protein
LSLALKDETKFSGDGTKAKVDVVGNGGRRGIMCEEEMDKRTRDLDFLVGG